MFRGLYFGLYFITYYKLFMKNRYIAVFAGLITAVLSVVLFDFLAKIIFGMPEVAADANRDMLKEYMHNIPTGVFALMLMGWFIGSVLGPFVTAKLADQDVYKRSMTVGVVLLVATIINLITIPHPIWVWIIGIICIMPGAVLGFRLSGKSRK